MGKVLLEKVLWEDGSQRERLIVEETFRAEFIEINTRLEDTTTGYFREIDSVSLCKADTLSLAKWILENVKVEG